MSNFNKRPRAAVMADTRDDAPPNEGFPLPESVILDEILKRLDLESFCSMACVCRNLQSIVSQALLTLHSLNLSAFSPNGEILACTFPRLRGVTTITIDCLRLEDWSVINILGPGLRELNLLKCAFVSYNLLASIGDKCPNIRILVLDLAGERSPKRFKTTLVEMLKRLLYLESLSIKVRGTELDAYDLSCIDLFLPKTLKHLKLQPVNDQDAIRFIEELKDKRESPQKSVNSTISSHLAFTGFTLTRLSLVLNVISDRLITSITISLPFLVELELEDRPFTEPKLPHDLTNHGLQSLCSCQHLTSLSIMRSRVNAPVSFKRVDNLGVMLLSESCMGLESVKLGGFSTVTDAGFSSILTPCYNLKKFEVRYAPMLSDLAFHDINGAICPLVELKLLSCNLVTSEAIAELASSRTLEILDTNGCRSIADSCLEYISCLSTLTTVNLGGADITDHGLVLLGKGNLPIVNLSLRSCTRVTDRGIISLFKGGDRIKKTLSSLDIGRMPGISDRGVHAIASSAEVLTEMCMRYCFHVTASCLRALGSRRGDWSLIRRLDLCHCSSLSCDGLVELLQRRLFRGLRWVGVDGTSLANKRDDFDAICGVRRWLTVCFEGCEVGCHDGWQFHRDNGISS